MIVELSRTGVMKPFSELSAGDWFYVDNPYSPHQSYYAMKMSEWHQILSDHHACYAVGLEGVPFDPHECMQAKDFMVEVVEKKVIE